MKRFSLLTLLVALFSVTAFAQKGLHLRPMEPIQRQAPAIKLIDRQAQAAVNVVRHAAGELVTPPATANIETWYTVDGTFYI